MDPDSLREMVGLMRELGVSEYASNGVHIVLGKPTSDPAEEGSITPVASSARRTPTNRDVYTRMFNGDLPSWPKYKAGQ